MKVIFHTNIDAYNEKRCFPEHFDIAPRKGDFIQVKPDFDSYYRGLKLPNRLEVVNVTWKEHCTGDAFGHDFGHYETIAYCELWYNQTDLEMAKMAGGKPL